MAVSLNVNLGGLEMKNPVTTASGTYASGREYSAFVDPALLGAVTTKACLFMAGLATMLRVLPKRQAVCSIPLGFRTLALRF